jgi:hypothetical protein
MPKGKVKTRKSAKVTDQDYPQAGTLAKRVGWLKEDVEVLIEALGELTVRVDALERTPPSTSILEIKALRDQSNGQSLRLEALEAASRRSLWRKIVGGE